jgi:hypothetical protein
MQKDEIAAVQLVSSITGRSCSKRTCDPGHSAKPESTDELALVECRNEESAL